MTRTNDLVAATMTNIQQLMEFASGDEEQSRDDGAKDQALGDHERWEKLATAYNLLQGCLR